MVRKQPSAMHELALARKAMAPDDINMFLEINAHFIRTDYIQVHTYQCYMHALSWWLFNSSRYPKKPQEKLKVYNNKFKIIFKSNLKLKKQS